VTTDRLHRSRPLVSIITPSFEQGLWLGDNLASVAAQDYPNIEHVVMDGGSTDGSVGILQASDPEQVRWRSGSDLGQSDAINKAFAASSGEIIGWLNSDDAYFRPNAVSLAVDAFERHPEAVLVYGHAALVNADGRVLHVLWSPASAQRLMRFHNFLVQPAVFIRRSAIGSQLVDPDFDYMMDWELWLRLAPQGAFVRVDRILAIDRHQAGRKVETRPDLAAQDRQRLDQRYRLASGLLARSLAKPLKVGYRLAGAGHVGEASTTPLAFSGRRDRHAALLGRQLFVPRRRMAFEDGGDR
jgi:glycosyltransferase involved in cell wall biosynthesis